MLAILHTFEGFNMCQLIIYACPIIPCSAQACTSEDDTWFDFVSGVKVFDELTANPLNQGAFSRRLYWEGPPAGVDIVLDDIK